MGDYRPIELFYLISAGIGGLLFILRLIFSFFGGADGDLGDSADGGLDLGESDSAAGSISDGGFKLFSLQGITGFFMMFGLVGLTLARAGVHDILTALAGLAAGGLTMVIVAAIFMGMRRLQSEGTLRISNAVGKEGTVYLTIPENGSGQVSVVVQGGLRQFEAVSASRERIPTGEKIRVVRVVSSNILVVERIQ